MSFFKSLPEDAGVRHILTLNPQAGRALVEFHTAALRNEGPLEPRHKELIAAYVSGLNACQYCFGVHAVTAKAFGLEAGTLERLLADIDSADVDERLKPLLRYARKLTLEPSRMTEADAQAVFAAGWSEAALHEAVLTVCLFNFMNRLLEGHGVKGNPGVFSARGQALRDEGYEPLLAFLDAAAAPPSAHRV
ncbi:carboxymuconolactone decarboxylase family protein [Hydrogenophaga sp.]|uniref:carboxymuconolactone decarboxylase family protein n=1 Tax=Hydrogenophaga sp. TaxID=1904254 RepID=UPI0027337D04|nr:peroxidase-related enzyme [Hydrogenophaga sp.]MDP3886127.1 peroxidase-related enzyme [Hydrogenophaga sp.]